jgi:hypothetical protein
MKVSFKNGEKYAGSGATDLVINKATTIKHYFMVS